jgi:hypothetical protein
MPTKRQLAPLLIIFVSLALIFILAVVYKPIPQQKLDQVKETVKQPIKAVATITADKKIKTVFVIVMENHNWSDIKNNDDAPYINKTLLKIGAHAEEYYNPPSIHPSEPNYIWMEAGDNLGVKNDADAYSNHQSTTEHFVTQLQKAGHTWKTYQEDIDGTICPLANSGKYAAKHNPFIFFDDVTNSNDKHSQNCISHMRPYTELSGDLEKNSVADYNFITPNLCHDMHDCNISTGDTWLSQEVPKILSSQAYKDNGALFVLWEEAEGGSDGPIGFIALSPLVKTGYASSVHYTHSSLLRTLQDIFGVQPYIRDAANASNLSDLFTSF